MLVLQLALGQNEEKFCKECFQGHYVGPDLSRNELMIYRGSESLNQMYGNSCQQSYSFHIMLITPFDTGMKGKNLLFLH